MKIVATADWHIHEFSDFSKPMMVEWNDTLGRYVESANQQAKEMNSRLFHILNGICDIRDYAYSNEISVVLHAGDVFHKRGSISVNAFNSACKVIKSFNNYDIRLIMISGNHDQVDNSQIPASSIHTFNSIAEVVETPQVIPIMGDREKINVVAIPYSRDKKYVLNSLKKLKSEVESKNSVLLMHCGVTGGTVGSGMYIMSDEYSLGELMYDKWKYVVLGHYHQPQFLAHNTIYCGTPVQNTFNDELPDDSVWEGYNGFFVLDTQNDNIVKLYKEDVCGGIIFVPVTSVPRFITVKSADDIAEQSDNYYRVKAEQKDIESVVSKTEGMSNVRVEVEKTYENVSRSDIGLDDTLEDAITKYVKENYKGNNPEMLKVGLSILHSVTVGGDVDDI